MKLTKNFDSNEFNCHDGTAVPDELMPNVKKLAQQLQRLRDELGEPIHINSGYRSPAYNKKIGGVQDSQHVQGKAADITVKSKSPKQLAAIIESLIKDGSLYFGGIGVYPGFVHVDIRMDKARWKG